MDDHARILKHGVHAPSVRRSRGNLEEGIAPGCEQQGKEGHDGKVEHPVPQSGFPFERFIRGGELEDEAAQRDHERPEQQRACLSGPEGRYLVEQRKKAVGVVRHIFQGKVARNQGIHQYAGGHDKTARSDKVGPFQPAEVGVAPLPELCHTHARTSQGAEQGKKKQNICGKIHAFSEKGSVPAGMFLRAQEREVPP